MALVQRTGIEAALLGTAMMACPVRFFAYFTCDHYAPLSEEVP
jgi:hypothetical protein